MYFYLESLLVGLHVPSLPATGGGTCTGGTGTLFALHVDLHTCRSTTGRYAVTCVERSVLHHVDLPVVDLD